MTLPTTPRASAPTALPLAPRWIALALFVVTLLLRLPFASRTLNQIDSVNHALALSGYNLAIHRPQPPGYILYIGLARLINLLLPDPHTALVAVSVGASALAVALLFLLGVRFGSVRTGLFAALLLLTNPAFWFDSEVALPYVVEGCLSVLIALLCYAALEGDKRWLMLTAVLFAIAIGFRQQLVVFLGPLVLYVFWRQSWRKRIEGALWFGGVCLLWFVPLILSAGGVEPFMQIMRAYNAAFSGDVALSGTGGARALGRNVSHLGAYTLYALNLTLVPLGIGVARAVRTRGVNVWRAPRVKFLGVWALPSILFYLLFHMGSPGLIYVFLSALLLAAAYTLDGLTRSACGWGMGLWGLCVATNLFIFFVTPPDLYTGRAFRVLNYSSLVADDRAVLARSEGIQSQFDPASTLVLAADWRIAEYYLPQYRVLSFKPQDSAAPYILASGRQEVYGNAESIAIDGGRVRTIVFYDPNARAFLKGDPSPQCKALTNGECLSYVELLTNQQPVLTNTGVELGAR